MLAGLSITGVIIPHTAHERAELRRSRRHGAGRDGGRAGEAAADGGGKGKVKGRGKKIERRKEKKEREEKGGGERPSPWVSRLLCLQEYETRGLPAL